MRLASVEVIPYALPFKDPYVTARGPHLADVVADPELQLEGREPLAGPMFRVCRDCGGLTGNERRIALDRLRCRPSGRGFPCRPPSTQVQ